MSENETQLDKEFYLPGAFDEAEKLIEAARKRKGFCKADNSSTK